MEILKEFDFDSRESRSQWAPFIDELIDNPGIHAIKLDVGATSPRPPASTTPTPASRTTLARRAAAPGCASSLTGSRLTSSSACGPRARSRKVRRAKKSTRPAPVGA
jgi:hypothetical protein